MDSSQNAPSSKNFLSIVIAVLVILGFFFFVSKSGLKPSESATSPTPATPTASTAQIPSLKSVSISIDDDAVLGRMDAPVTIIEFGDYQCPFCEDFYGGAELSIRNAYVSKGLVRFAYRDFPLDAIHP